MAVDSVDPLHARILDATSEHESEGGTQWRPLETQIADEDPISELSVEMDKTMSRISTTASEVRKTIKRG